MAGTKAGGIKAAKMNNLLYGNDFYSRIGHRGGSHGHTGGFASKKVGKDGLTGWQRAKIVGAKGGSISRRTGILNGHGATSEAYLRRRAYE